MKTRIQDLDDKVFQDLISDQLCKGDLYKDTDVTHTTLTSINHYSPESKSNSKYSNQDIGPPALVKEPLVFDGEVKPKEMKRRRISIYIYVFILSVNVLHVFSSDDPFLLLTGLTIPTSTRFLNIFF
jgi:hypothetical protein